jgi:hypothetical protein
MSADILTIARKLVEIEFYRYKADSVSDHYDLPAGHSQRVGWIGNSRDTICNVLEQVASSAYQQQPTLSARMNVSQNRSSQSTLTREQIFEQNLRPNNANATFTRMLKVSCNLNSSQFPHCPSPIS